MRGSMFIRTCLVAFALLRSEPASAGAAGDPAPDALLEEVRADGARAVIKRLSAREDEFDRMLGHIEAGEDKWLRVAAALYAGSDASYSLALSYAVARAIPRNPAGVVALIDRPFPSGMLCTSPFIEPAPGVAERYEARALNALHSVEGRWAKMAARCADKVRLPEDSSVPAPQAAVRKTTGEADWHGHAAHGVR